MTINKKLFLSLLGERDLQELRMLLSVSSDVKLKQSRDEYIDSMQHTHSKAYIQSSNSSLTAFMKFVGDIPLSKIDMRMAEGFVLNHFKRSQYSAALHYRNLKAAFNKFLLWKYIVENPFVQVKLPRMHKPKPTYLTPAELQIILGNTSAAYLKDIFVFAFNSGLRLGELLNLKWNAVDLKKRVVTVRNTPEFNTKNKMDRVIPINQELFIVLKNRYPKVIDYKLNEYVFWKVKGVKLNNDFVSKQFKKVVRASALDNKIHFHTLRHSFASQLAQKDVSLYVIQKLLGHNSIITTQTYSHLNIDTLRNATDKLSIVVEGCLL
ncbi:MAG: site-specific integrase [Bacteroidetes bacterium]|nr:site-specific integrase [Bacteroidota bacterium]